MHSIKVLRCSQNCFVEIQASFHIKARKIKAMPVIVTVTPSPVCTFYIYNSRHPVYSTPTSSSTQLAPKSVGLHSRFEQDGSPDVPRLGAPHSHGGDVQIEGGRP